MPTPSRAPVVDAPTPARAYVLECKLKRAYAALYQQQVGSIWHAPTRRAAAQALMQAHVGETYAKRWGEKRLSQEMPELIQRLTIEQQPQLAAVLLVEAPDLGQVVALLVKLERNLNYRDDDPRLSINDDARLKAAGLGRLSRQQYDAKWKWGPPLELTPWVPPPPEAAHQAEASTPRAAGAAGCLRGAGAIMLGVFGGWGAAASL